MYYIQDRFAHVLLWEQLSMLFTNLAGFTYACNLLLGKYWEFDDDPFRLHFFELLEVDVAKSLWLNLLCHNSMSASALWPLANISDFISWDSRMNIQPSLQQWMTSWYFYFRSLFHLWWNNLISWSTWVFLDPWFSNGQKIFIIASTQQIISCTNNTCYHCWMGYRLCGKLGEWCHHSSLYS